MKNIIENHKKAAMHAEEAAKQHQEAAKHHEDGKHEKAHESTIKAQGHITHVTEAQKEIQKNHTTKK